MLSVREEISKNLLYYRKKAGLTQKQLAEKIGVKNTAVSNWESGNNSIDIDTLCLVCDVFGITLNDMYGGYSDRPSMLDEEKMRLLSAFSDLNEEGREKVFAYINDLSMTGIYKKRDPAVVVSKEA